MTIYYRKNVNKSRLNLILMVKFKNSSHIYMLRMFNGYTPVIKRKSLKKTYLENLQA